MSVTPDKQFKRIKNGDSAALYDILEGERGKLYDYMMRMTGQVSRSGDTIDEVYQSLGGEALELIDSLTELRVCLYTTARKFSGDIWNADTAKLVNPLLEERTAKSGHGDILPSGDPMKLPGAELIPKQDRPMLIAVDRALRLMPGREREALLLPAPRPEPGRR